jgi:glycosyltransferase involved in cell wall biosynthesis
MKLVLVADTFPPLRTSGAVQLRDLARELVRQGNSLTVMLPESELKSHWQIEEFDGAEILHLKAPRTKDIGYVQRTIGEWLMPYAMHRNLLRSPLRERRWDGVVWYSPSIFHAPLVNALKRRNGCVAYLIIRDIFPEWAVDLGLMRRGLTYRFFKRIARQQYDAADIIGVQTPGNLAYFEHWSKANGGRSLEVLANWLGRPASLRCRIRIDETNLARRKILVYAGNMGIAQGMDILIDLAARMQSRRDIGFVFVGRGSDSKRLSERARSQTPDNTLFFDEIDPDEIPDLYAQCDVGIVALDPRHNSHNIPGKFLTYMQNGLPVLANLNPSNDLAELIRREEVGEICETNSLNQLESRCEALMLRLDTDTNLKERCKSLFDRNFAVSHAAQQITSGIANKRRNEISG